MSTQELQLHIADESGLDALVRALLPRVRGGGLITLGGELGTGKTTLVRALLRALGVRGRIRSPTYSLVEPYDIPGLRILHLDLYRLGSPDELDDLGLREQIEPGVLMLVEWPERGGAALPAADMHIALAHTGSEARDLRLQASSEWAQQVLDACRT